MNAEEARLKTEAIRRGMSVLEVGAEVLRVLPESFVLRYELLWLRAFGPSVGGSGAVRDPEAQVKSTPSGAKVRTSSGQADARGGAKRGRAGLNGRQIVKDDRAVHVKSKVDRKLRTLAREIGVFLGDGLASRTMRRCKGLKCKRWAEDTWNYCPHCGIATEEVDV